MNKIGIVTFNNAINYGAVFQCYALQEFLKKMDCNPFVINYRSKFIEKCYSPFYISNRKVLNGIVRGLFFGRIMNNKKKRFESFCNKYLNLSKKIYTNRDMCEYVDTFDFFISGSDQVWSPISANFDEFYFLPFAKKHQKRSYAASIGSTSLDSNIEDALKKRLNDYPFYSVREESAKNIIQKLFPEKKVFVNIDPTLLLSKNEWEKVASVKEHNEKYLLVFNVEKEINDLLYAKKIAKENGLKVYYINDRTLRKDKDIKYIEAPKPEDFLNLFKNAEIIITNSFHGTVFSIIFEKEFYVELENKKARNIRSEALLEYLNLEDRVINNKNINNNNKINWQDVKCLIDKKRQESINYFELIKNNI